MPALPLHEAGKYVAAAYVVVFALVLIYVAIMAVRLGRIERELAQLLATEDELSNRSGATPHSGVNPATTATATDGVDAAAPGRSDTATRDSDAAPDPLDVGRPQSTHA